MYFLDTITRLVKNDGVINNIESIVTSLAVVIGGIWAYTRFRRGRENYSWIEFNTEINVIGKKESWYIIELIAFLENKGKVRHKIKSIEFELAVLKESDTVDLAPQFRNQVHFPHTEKGHIILAEENQYYFIEPGIKSKYSYVTRVKGDVRFIMLHSNFIYQDNKRSHTAEKTIDVLEKER